MAGKPIECRAAVMWSPNTDLVLETVLVSAPKEKEVRIKVLYSGVCFSDIHIQMGHNKTIQFPILAGHESVGVVESVGPGVKSVKTGDTVIPIWCSECGECSTCTKKSPKRNVCGLSLECEARGSYSDGTKRVTCKGIDVSSMCRIGTFSEYIVVPEVAVAKIRSDLNLEKVALYGCCVPTGYGAAKMTAQVRRGSTVAVWGLGAVGLCTVMGARDCQASKIVGIDLNPDKFDIATKFGCTDCVNLRDYPGKSTKEIVGSVLGLKDGFDYTFICVGASAAADEAIDCATINGGEIILVGLVETLIKIDPMHLLCGKILKGTFGGDYHFKENIPELLDSYLAGKFPTDDLITHTLPFDQINQGFELLKKGKSLRTILKY